MANFKLTQTGEQIQADLDLLDKNSATQGQVLTANGTGGATWQNASGGGTEVVANPTLAGTESELTGLQVAGTKYKVPSGGSGGGTQLYSHIIEIQNGNITAKFTLYSSIQDEFNIQTLFNYLSNRLSINVAGFVETVAGEFHAIANISFVGSPELTVNYIKDNNVLSTIYHDNDYIADTVTPL